MEHEVVRNLSLFKRDQISPETQQALYRSLLNMIHNQQVNFAVILFQSRQIDPQDFRLLIYFLKGNIVVMRKSKEMDLLNRLGALVSDFFRVDLDIPSDFMFEPWWDKARALKDLLAEIYQNYDTEYAKKQIFLSVQFYSQGYQERLSRFLLLLDGQTSLRPDSCYVPFDQQLPELFLTCFLRRLFLEVGANFQNGRIFNKTFEVLTKLCQICFQKFDFNYNSDAKRVIGEIMKKNLFVTAKNWLFTQTVEDDSGAFRGSTIVKFFKNFYKLQSDLEVTETNQFTDIFQDIFKKCMGLMTSNRSESSEKNTFIRNSLEFLILMMKSDSKSNFQIFENRLELTRNMILPLLKMSQQERQDFQDNSVDYIRHGQDCIDERKSETVKCLAFELVDLFCEKAHGFLSFLTDYLLTLVDRGALLCHLSGNVEDSYVAQLLGGGGTGSELEQLLTEYGNISQGGGVCPIQTSNPQTFQKQNGLHWVILPVMSPHLNNQDQPIPPSAQSLLQLQNFAQNTLPGYKRHPDRSTKFDELPLDLTTRPAEYVALSLHLLANVANLANDNPKIVTQLVSFFNDFTVSITLLKNPFVSIRLYTLFPYIAEFFLSDSSLDLFMSRAGFIFRESAKKSEISRALVLQVSDSLSNCFEIDQVSEYFKKQPQYLSLIFELLHTYELDELYKMLIQVLEKQTGSNSLQLFETLLDSLLNFDNVALVILSKFFDLTITALESDTLVACSTTDPHQQIEKLKQIFVRYMGIHNASHAPEAMKICILFLQSNIFSKDLGKCMIHLGMVRDAANSCENDTYNHKSPSILELQNLLQNLESTLTFLNKIPEQELLFLNEGYSWLLSQMPVFFESTKELFYAEQVIKQLLQLQIISDLKQNEAGLFEWGRKMGQFLENVKRGTNPRKQSDFAITNVSLSSGNPNDNNTSHNNKANLDEVIIPLWISLDNLLMSRFSNRLFQPGSLAFKSPNPVTKNQFTTSFNQLLSCFFKTVELRSVDPSLTKAQGLAIILFAEKIISYHAFFFSENTRTILAIVFRFLKLFEENVQHMLQKNQKERNYDNRIGETYYVGDSSGQTNIWRGKNMIEALLRTVMRILVIDYLQMKNSVLVSCGMDFDTLFGYILALIGHSDDSFVRRLFLKILVCETVVNLGQWIELDEKNMMVISEEDLARIFKIGDLGSQEMKDIQHNQNESQGYGSVFESGGRNQNGNYHMSGQKGLGNIQTMNPNNQTNQNIVVIQNTLRSFKCATVCAGLNYYKHFSMKFDEADTLEDTLIFLTGRQPTMEVKQMMAYIEICDNYNFDDEEIQSCDDDYERVLDEFLDQATLFKARQLDLEYEDQEEEINEKISNKLISLQKLYSPISTASELFKSKLNEDSHSYDRLQAQIPKQVAQLVCRELGEACEFFELSQLVWGWQKSSEAVWSRVCRFLNPQYFKQLRQVRGVKACYNVWKKSLKIRKWVSLKRPKRRGGNRGMVN